jgi:hypothetical protein
MEKLMKIAHLRMIYGKLHIYGWFIYDGLWKMAHLWMITIMVYLVYLQNMVVFHSYVEQPDSKIALLRPHWRKDLRIHTFLSSSEKWKGLYYDNSAFLFWKPNTTKYLGNCYPNDHLMATIFDWNFLWEPWFQAK